MCFEEIERKVGKFWMVCIHIRYAKINGKLFILSCLQHFLEECQKLRAILRRVCSFFFLLTHPYTPYIRTMHIHRHTYKQTHKQKSDSRKEEAKGCLASIAHIKIIRTKYSFFVFMIFR